MRATTILLAALALGVPSAMADVPPASAPATVAPGQAAPAAPTVLVLPFQQTGDATTYSWIAPAIQEDLLGQVARTGVFQPVSVNQPVAGADSATALQIARANNANVVIFGGYQVVADQLRIDGQAVDVATGRVIGALQATGAMADLFKIEDALGLQFHQLFPPPASSDMPAISYGYPNEPVTTAAVPDTTATPPDQSNYSSPDNYGYQAPYYGQTYWYPGYGYGYGFYYGPPIYYFNGGFNRWNHFHGGGWNGHWSQNGGHWGGSPHAMFTPRGPMQAMPGGGRSR